jgi:hypothetical protein
LSISSPKTNPANNFAHSPDTLGAHPERVYDRDILGEYYPGIRPFTSPTLGLYWCGALELLDGSAVQVIVLEDATAKKPTYSVTLKDPPNSVKNVGDELAKAEFSSACAALIATERSCNRALYQMRDHVRETNVTT